MHLFPQLRKLEKKYEKELAVIGVHSAKFPTEQETESVRMAILRYEIGHPVINDSQFKVWKSYACRARASPLCPSSRGESTPFLSTPYYRICDKWH